MNSTHTDHFNCQQPLLSSLSVSFNPSLSLSLSLCLAFSPSCYEGHQASGDAVPQEESKLASPSLPLFFHNLLFMSDRPPPDKWLPYGERKAEEREGRKNSLCILFLPVDFWVFLSGILTFWSVFWRHFFWYVGLVYSRHANGRVMSKAACRLIEPMEISALSPCKEMYSFCGLQTTNRTYTVSVVHLKESSHFLIVPHW